MSNEGLAIMQVREAIKYLRMAIENLKPVGQLPESPSYTVFCELNTEYKRLEMIEAQMVGTDPISPQQAKMAL